MLYERPQDREGQEFVRERLQRHLSTLPLGRVEVNNTPQAHHLSHDLEIHVSGLWVGVAEVKVRSRPAQWFLENGWFFELQRLEALKSKFYGVGGKWIKSVALILCTSDRYVFLLSVETLIANWDKVRRVEGMARDDHGEIPVDKPGIIIPLDIMQWLPGVCQYDDGSVRIGGEA